MAKFNSHVINALSCNSCQSDVTGSREAVQNPQEITPKQVEEAADNGMPFINYSHLHRQVWAKPIEPELSEMIEKEFALPYFEFVYDEHWDLGHGWSGDL